MIDKMIESGESKTVEFKSFLPKGNQIVKTVCAFANRAGGHILIGVSDNGQLLGLSEDDLNTCMESLPNIIHDMIYPMILPEIYTYSIEGKRILIIKIYPGNMPPYYLKNKGKVDGTYVRVGRTNKLADLEMLQELERQRINKSFDEDLFGEVSNHDKENLVELLNLNIERKISSNKLENLRLVEKQGKVEYLSNAGAIILGKVDYSKIKCGRFLGDSIVDFADKKEFEGSIFRLIETSLMFLKDHLHMSSKITGQGLRRKDSLEIPEEILREGIINAVLHRDYSMSGSDIKIAVFDSRIEITSPGGFPKSLTVEEIYAGRSEVRNKVLANVLVKAGLIEQWGSGIPRMREIAAREGLIEPEIVEKGLFVTLTIYRKGNNSANMSEKNRKRTGTKSYEIDKEKKAIINLISDDIQITIKEISDVIGISETSALRRVQSLQDEGRVKRVGSRKTGYWIVDGESEPGE